MTRLLSITLILIAATALAASQKLNELPLIGNIKADSRLYVYDTLSGNRNITGSDLKAQALGGNGALVKQAFSSFTSQWAGPNSIHRRVSEIRNAAGKIVYYVTAAGRMSIGGHPFPFAVLSVSPTNGTTDIFNNYSARACTLSNCSTMTGIYWNQKKWTGAKYVIYNKGVKPSVSSATDQFIVGKTLPLTSSDGFKYTFADYSVAAGTTYTIKVWLENFRKYQTDGEWTASCPGMTDTGDGYCTSTFTTRN